MYSHFKNKRRRWLGLRLGIKRVVGYWRVLKFNWLDYFFSQKGEKIVLRSSIKKICGIYKSLTNRDIIIFNAMENINLLIKKYHAYCKMKGEAKEAAVCS